MLIDLHNDVLLPLGKAELDRYFAHLEKAGLTGVFTSVWCTELSNPMAVLTEKKEILQNLKTKIKLHFHVEDAWFLTPQNIDSFLALKPFSVGLTWNQNNALAGGACSDGDLTEQGRETVDRLNKNHVRIDLAHLNEKSFFSVLDFIPECPFCSHTCFSSVYVHKRNLTDRQISKIVQKNGLVGLTLVPQFLCAGACGKEQVFRHISHFINRFGSDHLAIGTDFFGSKQFPADLDNYQKLTEFRGFLIQKGLNNDSIDKIFYKNAQRFLCSLPN